MANNPNTLTEAGDDNKGGGRDGTGRGGGQVICATCTCGVCTISLLVAIILLNLASLSVYITAAIASYKVKIYDDDEKGAFTAVVLAG